MEEELARFLAGRTRLSGEKFEWGSSLLITYYLNKDLPPLEYVSSVRAIVFQKRSVLVIQEANGHMHIILGGRVENGESVIETLKREILEETGWTLLKTQLLGLMHCHHLGPKPENYQYPYPDFLWPIYIAEANKFAAAAKIPDEWVFKSEFRPFEDVRNLSIEKGELLLLEAALKLR